MLSGALDSLSESSKQADAGPWLTQYNGRELEFVRDVLGARSWKTRRLLAWKFQRDYMRTLFAGHDCVCGSARLSGKSKMIAGMIAPAAMATRPCRVIMLSTGLDQVRDTLMAYLNEGYQSQTHTLPGVMGKTRLEIDASHYLTALPTKNSNRARGYHGGVTLGDDPDADELSPEDLEAIALDPSMAGVELFLLIDEGQNIDAEYYRVIQGIQKARSVHTSLTGNTTLGVDDDHEYVKALMPGSDYKRFRVSTCSTKEELAIGIPADPWLEGYETGDVYRIPHTLSPREGFEKALRELDKSDPIFWSDWLGRLLTGATSNQVVPRSALEAAIGWRSNGRPAEPIGPRVGIDIGTGSPDPCVASLFFDGEKVGRHEWSPPSDDPAAQMSIARTIATLLVRWGEEIEKAYPGRWSGPISGPRVSIDDTGLSGVCDILFEYGIEVDRVVFSAKPQGHHRDITGSQRFLNLRAEMFWVARRGLQTGRFLIPEKYRQSWQQLPWTRFLRDHDGKGSVIKMEKKELIKARHGRSPDEADADVLAMRESAPMMTAGQAGPPTATGSVTDNEGARYRRRRRDRLHGGFEIM